MSTARSLNKAIIIGNLTRNPVIRTTTNGATVCIFGVATNATWRDSSGNAQERTEFHNIVAWNKLAEICAQLLATGMLVFIEGELRTRTWDDVNGIRHYRTEIKIDDMKLLDDKGKKGVGIENAKKDETDTTINDEPEKEESQEDKKKEIKKEEEENEEEQKMEKEEDINQDSEKKNEPEVDEDDDLF